MDLSYLGSSAGMPMSGAPGLGSPSTFLNAPAPASPQGGPAAPGGLPLPPSLMAPPDPASMQYEAVTQVDGSILLHIKNPDGSLGPAVQIINPVKPGGKRK